MDAPEARRRHSNADTVEAYFKARPYVWIKAADLEAPGGRQGWRTRVSECRKKRGMCIQNRQRRMNGEAPYRISLVISEYRYLPYTPLGSDAADLRERTLFDGDFEGTRR